MKKYIFLLLAGSLLGSCTDHFENLNLDKSGVIYEQEGEGAKDPAIEYLALAQRAMYPDDDAYPIAAWVLQLQTNLNVDIWAGYLASGTFFLSGINNQTYSLVDSWNSYMYSYWARTMGQVKDMLTSYDNLSNPGKGDNCIKAMGMITRVMASVRAADMYGTLTYTTFGGSAAEYDSMEDIYNTFFKELDEAVSLLKNGESVNGTDKDLFYAGNRDNWWRLANSMRLRLALRIVKANPTLAKAEAEKAIGDEGGLITDNLHNAGYTAKLLNGLCVLAQAWGDTRMSADMESILTGYQDPRLPYYFSTINGKYKGVRVGSVFTGNSGSNYSSLGTAFPVGATYEKAPIYMFTAAETHFLLAEAALRGFAGAGDAATHYNNGIEVSMGQWGIMDAKTIAEYKVSDARFADWKSDVAEIATNVPAQSNVTPNFSDASGKEEQLEKIITQKWIAMFPGGSTEAWSEYRRTGYPRLIPPYKAYSKPRISVSYGPGMVNNAKKVRLAEDEYNVNSENVEKAVMEFFNGVDALSTPVWWDKDVPNF